jgi:hypothetical protein
VISIKNLLYRFQTEGVSSHHIYWTVIDVLFGLRKQNVSDLGSASVVRKYIFCCVHWIDVISVLKWITDHHVIKLYVTCTL